MGRLVGGELSVATDIHGSVFVWYLQVAHTITYEHRFKRTGFPKILYLCVCMLPYHRHKH